MTPKFTLTPEASEFLSEFATGIAEYDAAADRAVERMAELCVKRTRRAILGQSFETYPLSPGWIAAKRRKGLDPRILIATQEYIDSFSTVKLGPANYAVSAKEPLFDWLSEGTSRMHARRHFDKAQESVMRDATDIAAEEIMKAVFGGFS